MIPKTTAPDVQQAIDLYVATGWGTYDQYDPAQWQTALAQSHCLSHYDGERLVGLLRSITDGSHATSLLELVVHPAYRGQGIGSQLMTLFLERCGHTDIYVTALAGAADFLTRFGLQTRPALVAMSRRAA